MQAQQVDEAVAGGLEDRHLDGQQAGGGQEDGPPGEADLADDRRAGDEVGGEGDHAEAPQHQDQQEGAQAAGAPGRPRGAGRGGGVHVPQTSWPSARRPSSSDSWPWSSGVEESAGWHRGRPDHRSSRILDVLLASRYLDPMEGTTTTNRQVATLTAATSSRDPEVGLRAVAALRGL